MGDFFEIKPPRLKIVLAIVFFVVALCGCSHLTVAPKPVNAKVIAFDENTQNAGIIDCDQNGCLVTPNWYARYKKLEADAKITIAADTNIKPEGKALPDGRFNYRISYETFNHFAELKAAERGP
jgi:hypothetical protein